MQHDMGPGRVWLKVHQSLHAWHALSTIHLAMVPQAYSGIRTAPHTAAYQQYLLLHGHMMHIPRCISSLNLHWTNELSM